MQLAGIELDVQHEWTDEYGWSPIEQTQERTLSGKLIIQQGVKVHGRPITLASNGGAWTPLSVVRQLEALRDQTGLVMPLTLPDGRTFSVVFNYEGGPPLEAVQVHRRVNPPPDYPYNVTLRLITVAPVAP